MNYSYEIRNSVLIVTISIFYVSSLYLADLISYKFDSGEFIYLMVMSLFFGFALISEKKIDCIMKWLISFPVSFFVFWCFQKADFGLRSLNWAFPGYGYPSAGAGFASLFLFVVFSFFCLVSGIISIFIKPKNYESFSKVQTIICASISCIIIIVVIVLLFQFPDSDSIRN